jgi:hypothetical protein
LRREQPPPCDPAEYNKLSDLCRETGHLSPAEETRMRLFEEKDDMTHTPPPDESGEGFSIDEIAQGAGMENYLPRSVRSALDELPESAASTAVILI